LCSTLLNAATHEGAAGLLGSLAEGVWQLAIWQCGTQSLTIRAVPQRTTPIFCIFSSWRFRFLSSPPPSPPKKLLVQSLKTFSRIRCQKTQDPLPCDGEGGIQEGSSRVSVNECLVFFIDDNSIFTGPEVGNSPVARSIPESRLPSHLPTQCIGLSALHGPLQP
jgi:hypothetical protein